MNKLGLAQFRKDITGIHELSHSEKELWENLYIHFDVKRRVLPSFPAGHQIQRIVNRQCPSREQIFLYGGQRYSDAKLWSMEKRVKEFDINPEQCIGDAWLFTDDRSEGRPKPNVMADLFIGDPANIPTPYLRKAGNYYFCTDGAHRIYAAYLLGRPVRISCDYEYLKIEPFDTPTD